MTMSAHLHGEWEAYQTLDRLCDPGAALNELVDFEAFLAILEDCRRPAEWPPTTGVVVNLVCPIFGTFLG